MSEVIEEIENAIDLLKLNLSVKRVTAGLEEVLFKELLDCFVEGGDRRWWWESFKESSKSILFENGLGFQELIDIVPDPDEVVWFVVEDDQSPFYPIYEASTLNIVKIIGECFAYEYYLIPKDKRWLICETHHNSIVGIGSEVISSIEEKGM